MLQKFIYFTLCVCMFVGCMWICIHECNNTYRDQKNTLDPRSHIVSCLTTLRSELKSTVKAACTLDY